MKTKKIVSLKPIEDRFKEVISQYMTQVREVRLKQMENEEAKEKASSKKGSKLKIVKIIWNIIVKIIAVIIVLISIIIVVQKVTNNKEAFLGYRIFRVQTGSMIPKYLIGDVILVK